MSHNPNTVKSQDDLPTTNDGKRSSDVLLSTIDKIVEVQQWNKDMQTKYGNVSAELEKTKKERDRYYNALLSIQYETPALGGDKDDMEHALCNIDRSCDWALRPEEMMEMEKNNGR